MTLPIPRVGLLAACADRKLFGVDLWPRQRELLAAVEQGPRLHVWALGRRSSKTTSAALVGLWDCLLRPELDALVRPGERRQAVAIATNLRQARLFVRAALSIVERSPLLAELVESATEDEIQFVNGTALSAFPCSSRGARGWPISTLLMDEAAHFLSETEGPQVAERVFEALVPSTAQFGEAARVIVASTPYGTGNLFSELFRRATSGELPDALAQHASTAEMNPTITPEFLEAERQRDPESFASEYLAEFLAGGSPFLDRVRVDEAVADRGELPPGFPLRDLVAGLDPAFSSDPFGVAIVGWDANTPGRLVLVAARRWLPGRRKPVSLEEGRRVEDAVLAEVAGFCRSYRARAVTDQFKAIGVVDRLQRLGVSVRAVPMGAVLKTAVFADLRARLNAGELELYPEPTLLGELRRLRSRYAAGRAAVEIPRVGGSHGDLAQALALATWTLRRHRGLPASGDVVERESEWRRGLQRDVGSGGFGAGEVEESRRVWAEVYRRGTL